MRWSVANHLLVDGQSRLVTYKEWADLIQANFEKCYYVPSDPSKDGEYNVNPGMINRRGIYKDVYGTPKEREWSDYQVSRASAIASRVPCGQVSRVMLHCPTHAECRTPQNGLFLLPLTPSPLTTRHLSVPAFPPSCPRSQLTPFQLRCNFTLPMIVAPELFTPEFALESLRIADASIRGPLGMKTLDPSDSQYRPNYDNSNDGTDQAIAKGWNVSCECGM